MIRISDIVLRVIWLTSWVVTTLVWRNLKDWCWGTLRGRSSLMIFLCSFVKISSLVSFRSIECIWIVKKISAVWLVLWQCGQGGYVFEFGLSTLNFSLCSSCFFRVRFRHSLMTWSGFFYSIDILLVAVQCLLVGFVCFLLYLWLSLWELVILFSTHLFRACALDVHLFGYIF